MTGRRVTLVAVAVAGLAAAGTAGVMEAVAGDGGPGVAPIVQGGNPPAGGAQKPTPGLRQLGTWETQGGGVPLVNGLYTPLDTPITVACKKAPCLLVADKSLIVDSGTNGTRIFPCVAVDGSIGGSSCLELTPSTGLASGASMTGTTIETKVLAAGTHTVQVKAYVGEDGASVGEFFVVYRLYH
jgi:hypothetical protein